jgi:OST-HTH/LOTUS domain
MEHDRMNSAVPSKEEKFKTRDLDHEIKSTRETGYINATPVSSSKFQQSKSSDLPDNVKEAFKCQLNSTKTSGKNMIPAVADLFASASQPEAKLRDEVTELLQGYPNGICLASFARAFEKKFGGSIEEHWVGFRTVYELLISMKDIVELHDLPGGDTLVKGRISTTKSPGMYLFPIPDLYLLTAVEHKIKLIPTHSHEFLSCRKSFIL